MCEDGPVNDDVHGGHATYGSVIGASRFLIGCDGRSDRGFTHRARPLARIIAAYASWRTCDQVLWARGWSITRLLGPRDPPAGPESDTGAARAGGGAFADGTWGYFRWPAVCGSGSILCPVLAGVRGAASSGRASAGKPVRVLVASPVVQPKALGCSIAAFRLDQAARGSALGIHLTGSVGVGRPGWDQWGERIG